MSSERDIARAVLAGRERRAEIIAGYMGEKALIVGVANTPGVDKSTPEARFLIRYFKKIVQQAGVMIITECENADGPFFLGTYPDVRFLKQTAVAIEEDHPLGRLIDLDVYTKSGSPLSRECLGYAPRSCLLCLRAARLCVRSVAHPLRDVKAEIKRRIGLFLEEKMRHIFDRAITAEAKLHPKFGLVTETSRGSHLDMDFALLMRAKSAILPFITRIFLLGYNEDEDIALMKARKAGLEAEAAMYAATGGVNAYKGLIFIVGFLALGLGSCFRHYAFNLFSRVALFGRDLPAEFTGSDTFGKTAFRKYRMSGARGEAHRGLPHVRAVLPLIKNYEDDTLTMALLYLMGHAEDTVFLKRAGSLRRFLEYRKIFKSITIYDKEQIAGLSAKCESDRLSFGGSADLLVAALCIKMTEEEFGYQYE